MANNDQWFLLTTVVLSSLTAVYQLLVAESVAGVLAPMGVRGTVADRRVHFNGGGGGPEQCRLRSVWHVPEKNGDAKTSQRPCRERRRRASATGQRMGAGFRGEDSSCDTTADGGRRRLGHGNDRIFYSMTM